MMSLAIHDFVTAYDTAKLGDRDDDEAFVLMQDANKCRRRLISGACKFIKIVHSYYHSNEEEDAAGRALVAAYLA